jgi:Methyltransferase domain
MNINTLHQIYKNQIDKRIEGCFSEYDLFMFWLLDLIQKHAAWRGDLCELGVYQGKTAISLGYLARPDEKLFCFDVFHKIPKSGVEATIREFCPELQDRLVCIPENLKLLRESPKTIEPGGMRFLHINSVHDHPAVLNDLNNFIPLLNNQAVIVLGNCFNPEVPGVITAMTEFCLSPRGRHIRPFASSREKMYLCGRHMVKAYQRLIVASELIKNMSFELVLDGAVLRCFSCRHETLEQLSIHL